MFVDTNLAALRAQRAVYRRMTPSKRVELACQMSEDARRVTEAGIRSRHPGLSDEAVWERLLQVILGGELYDKTRRP